MAALTCQAAGAHQTSLELAALPLAVSCARKHVRLVALEWGLAALADTAELLTSELVTNAVRASADLKRTAPPVVRLWTAGGDGCLEIHVWDAGAGLPARQEVAVDAQGGRGLLLIESLSLGWGAYRMAAGKVVWVRIG